MKRPWVVLVAVIVIMAMVGGCKTTSMNLQRSGLRSSGDLVVTGTLDAQESDTVSDSISKIETTCDKIETHLGGLDDGATLNDFRSAVLAEIPPATHFLIDAVCERVGKRMEGQVLSPDAVKRILAFVRGARSGATRYDMADRPQQE